MLMVMTVLPASAFAEGTYYSNFSPWVTALPGDDGTHASDYQVYIVEETSTPSELATALQNGTKCLSDLVVAFNLTFGEYDNKYNQYCVKINNIAGYMGDDFKSVEFKSSDSYLIVYKCGRHYKVGKGTWQGGDIFADDSVSSHEFTAWVEEFTATFDLTGGSLPTQGAYPNMTLTLTEGPINLYFADDELAPRDSYLLFCGSNSTISVTAAEGYKISKVIFYVGEDSGRAEGIQHEISTGALGAINVSSNNYSGPTLTLDVNTFTETYEGDGPFVWSVGYSVYPVRLERVRVEYKKEAGTSTAIGSIETEKAIKPSKVIKRIENGRVVIIRDDEKFDLAGRKL